MSGALTERAFVENLERAGFADVVVRERFPYGLNDLECEPTFPPDLVALMRRLLPPRLQERVGVRIVLEGRAAGVSTSLPPQRVSS